MMNKQIRVEIGGGTNCLPGYINVDPIHGEGRNKAKLGQNRLPFENNSVHAVRASHVMEHIEAGEPRLHALREVHRILAPHGTFEIVVPLMVGTWHAIADPTHVSFWCRESFSYLIGDLAANAHYDLPPWQFLGYMETDPDGTGVEWEATAVLRKPEQGEDTHIVRSAFDKTPTT